MVERNGATGPFYGCARFPICIGTRPQGEGVDSYSKLLHAAYLKATRFLSGPKYVGHQDVQRWMLEKAFDREPTEDELEDNQITSMATEHLERAIDAACDFASEQAGDTVDFLVYAHEERVAALSGRLSFVTTAEQIQRMPKPEIVRRYDTSELAQLEAAVAQHWKTDGMLCPRCGTLSEHKPDGVTLNLDGQSAKASKFELKVEDLNELFKTEGSDGLSVERVWECGYCGKFKRIETKKGGKISIHFEYEEDKKDGSVAGTSFRIPERKR